MEQLIKILEEIKPELNDEFDIEITPIDIVPENFKNAETIYAMVKRLEDE